MTCALHVRAWCLRQSQFHVNPIHTGAKPPMPEVDCSYLCNTGPCCCKATTYSRGSLNANGQRVCCTAWQMCRVSWCLFSVSRQIPGSTRSISRCKYVQDDYVSSYWTSYGRVGEIIKSNQTPLGSQFYSFLIFFLIIFAIIFGHFAGLGGRAV